MPNCLIVDDSTTIRKIISSYVKRLDFDSDEAENGAEALERCRATMPDAIVLDWNMPVMNGIEFIRHLRESPGGDKPRVVFCTTESGVAKIVTALDAGADEYIIKPFDFEMLQSKFALLNMA